MGYVAAFVVAWSRLGFFLIPLSILFFCSLPGHQKPRRTPRHTTQLPVFFFHLILTLAPRPCTPCVLAALVPRDLSTMSDHERNP